MFNLICMAHSQINWWIMLKLPFKILNISPIIGIRDIETLILVVVCKEYMSYVKATIKKLWGFWLEM